MNKLKLRALATSLLFTAGATTVSSVCHAGGERDGELASQISDGRLYLTRTQINKAYSSDDQLVTFKNGQRYQASFSPRTDMDAVYHVIHPMAFIRSKLQESDGSFKIQLKENISRGSIPICNGDGRVTGFNSDKGSKVLILSATLKPIGDKYVDSHITHSIKGKEFNEVPDSQINADGTISIIEGHNESEETFYHLMAKLNISVADFFKMKEMQRLRLWHQLYSSAPKHEDNPDLWIMNNKMYLTPSQLQNICKAENGCLELSNDQKYRVSVLRTPDWVGFDHVTRFASIVSSDEQHTDGSFEFSLVDSIGRGFRPRLNEDGGITSFWDNGGNGKEVFYAKFNPV